MINCAALNESLLESELFGHIKGAFTGAYRHRLGRFEAAHGGDIFLDEIGDVPLSIQVKLLRVLEAKAFERVGEHEPVSVDVRFITATHQDLEKKIERGEFREDFYFRINVIPIHLPPLRDRKDDIPLLVATFLERLRKRTGKPISGLAAEVLTLLMEYDWPGNVRELKSAMEYAFVVAEEGTIQPGHMPRKILATNKSTGAALFAVSGDAEEKQALIDALIATGGNQTQAARLLGINRVTVWNRMRKYGVDLKKVIAQPSVSPARQNGARGKSR
jgi:transcriptional regulator with GAF, ATPase, and Fis domain